MAIATYTIRVETNYGDFMKFPYEYDAPEDSASEFDPHDPAIVEEIYREVMDNLYFDLDFIAVHD